MTFPTEVYLMIRSKKGMYPFRLAIHEAVNLGELRLPAEFYGDMILSTAFFPHFEVEILEPQWAKDNDDKFDYYFSHKDRKPYIRFPGCLPTPEIILGMIRYWAIGQVCVREFDEYLNQMIADIGTAEAFFFWAKTRHGIEDLEICVVSSSKE